MTPEDSSSRAATDVHCPLCGSSSVEAITKSAKSIGKAFVGELTLGTAAGAAAASSSDLRACCLKCGAEWQPGRLGELQLKAEKGVLSAAERAELDEAMRGEIGQEAKNLAVGIGCGLFLLLFGWLATR